MLSISSSQRFVRVREGFIFALIFAIILHILLGLILVIHLTSYKHTIAPEQPITVPLVLASTPAMTHTSLPKPEPQQPIAERKLPVLKPIHKKKVMLHKKTVLNKAKKLVKMQTAKRGMTLHKHRQDTQHSLKLAQADVRHLLKEQLSKASPLSAQEQALLARYRDRIVQAIAQQWIIPPNVDKKLAATLGIHLAADGTVLSVEIIHSSHNALLDRSAQQAVYQASPLPIPHDTTMVDQFRALELIVRPEEVIER